MSKSDKVTISGFRILDFYENPGIIYRPTKEEQFIPQISAELMYRKNTVLIRGGVQIPISEMEYPFVPYFRLTYFLR